MITAAIVLAQTAVLYENLNAVQSQSYGAAARGGSTRSDVVIDNEEIYYPKVNQPNVLICLTQQAYSKFYQILRPGGLLLTDPRFVKTAGKIDARQKELPMYETIMDSIGKPIVFNTCMLGAVIALTEIVKPESIMKVLEERIPANFIDMNRKALELGIELGKSAKD